MIIYLDMEKRTGIKQRIQGSTDVPLNERGGAAHSLIIYLKN